MSNSQEEIIQELDSKPTIDPAEEVRKRVEFLVEYALAAKSKGFVLGISGGQDSTLAGKIAQLAAEELRARSVECTFFAVRLPYGTQADEKDAVIALDFIKPDRSLVIDIKQATDITAETTARALGIAQVSDFNKGNIKARQRMVTQYALAGENNLLVIGTDHAAENLAGFFTKFGDGAADILPLAGLSKRQGASLLQFLHAPASTWKKVPTADLEDNRPGLPDETALGVSYSEIDDFLAGKTISNTALDQVMRLWTRGGHKRHLPVTPADTWWR